MAEEWFWKHKGQMLGPLSTETLADLVQKRRVFDRDEVRFVESQQWINGGELKQLFAGSPGASTSEAAAALLAHVRRPDGSSEPPIAELELPQLRAPGIEGLTGWLSGAITDAVGWLFVAAALPLLVLFSRFGKPIIAAAVFVTVGVIILRSLDLSRSRNQRVVNDLMDSGAQLHTLRNKKTSETEWAEFATQTRDWLRPTIAELQARARRFPLQGSHWFEFERINARVRHDLLRAASALDKELDQGPLQLGDPVAFNSLLSEALNTLEGNEFRGWNQPRGPARPAADVDALTIAFIAFDVLLLVGGVAYWLRRKRARAA